MSDIRVTLVGAAIAVSLANPPIAVSVIGQQGPAGPALPDLGEGQLLFTQAAQVSGSPSLVFDPNTNQLAVTGNVSASNYVHHASGAGALTASGVQAGSGAAIGFTDIANATGTMDTMLRRGGAGILEQYNGATAQGYRLYYSRADANNYSRLKVSANSGSGASGILTEALGTGVLQALDLGSLGNAPVSLVTQGTRRWSVSGSAGHLTPGLSDTYDFGGGTARVRSVYANQIALSRAGSAVYGYLTAASDASNVIEIENGANPTALRVYGTRTDAANYTRMAQFWSGNTGLLLTQSAGTGAALNMQIGTTGVGTKLQFAAANAARWEVTATEMAPATDLGAALGSPSKRVGAGWFGTSLSVGRDLVVNATGAAGAGTGLKELLIKGPLGNNSWGGGVYLQSQDGATVTASVVASTNGIDFRFGTQNAWRINAAGHLLVESDNTNDIGTASNFRPRSGYFATSVVVGGSLTIVSDATSSRIDSVGGRSLILNPSGNPIALFGGFSFGTGRPSLLSADGTSVEQRNGVNPQTLRLYNTYTDASNYERVALSCASNVFTLGVENAGTGSARNLRIAAGATSSVLFATGGSDRWRFDSAGHLTAESDGVYDIGAIATKRPRSVYIAFDLFAGRAVKTGVVTVVNLPPASQHEGSRLMVSDANAALAAGLGAVVVGGGSNKVPVYSDGANWRIG